MSTALYRPNWTSIAGVVLPVILSASIASAVTSKITRHTSAKEWLAGECDKAVVTSQGTLQLGRAVEVLIPEFEAAWSINDIVVSGGTLFLGTSPNGNVYSYSLGTLTKIYPTQEEVAIRKTSPPGEQAGMEPNSLQERGENSNIIKAGESSTNEHVFAMTADASGRLLIGISGRNARLCRYETSTMETIFEPNDARYIFDIETDHAGNIYVGTGSEGKVYMLDRFGKAAQLIYDSPDKNILALAIGSDGFLYAGSDTRGLVYRINPRNQTVTILYDSDAPEISALLAVDGASARSSVLYATSTAANVAETAERFAARPPATGRPEARQGNGKAVSEGQGGMRLEIANTKAAAKEESSSGSRAPAGKTPPNSTSHLYRIDGRGYVTETFSETAVFLCLAHHDGRLLMGSGNSARLYTVDPEAARQIVTYEDEKAAQITAVTVSEQDVYIGTANPARLVRLMPGYAAEGSYRSDLIDAGQPARWGTLQIDADIPRGSRVLVAARSGNVKDVNDPTFSDWTPLTQITAPVQLDCPVGRFCQYKLVLEAADGRTTPLIREVAVSSSVSNQAPKIESVEASRLQDDGKEGFFKIGYKSSDSNNDTLTHKLYFRQIGRRTWIELKDRIESDSYEWDSTTVEDGRYEVRVVASDEQGNSPETTLSGSWISDPLVVDNTGPVIREHTIERNGRRATVTLRVNDALSVVGRLEYTVDSSSEWDSVPPDDCICDTTEECFTIAVDDLEPGPHVIALKVADDIGNVTVKTFEIVIGGY